MGVTAVKYNSLRAASFFSGKAQNILDSGRKFFEVAVIVIYAVSARLRRAFYFERISMFMNKRVAIIGIIVEKNQNTDKLNELLHEYGEYIIGRMGLPYRERGISVISVAIDAPQDTISALAGKIGRLDGISSKTLYSNS